MQYIDLNCDLGEGAGKDELLMPLITSANIACGYHAGDEVSMEAAVQLCQRYNVAIGAHPSFPDKDNFGRKELKCTYAEVYSWVQEQIRALGTIAHKQGAVLRHVKPHGALYNQAAKDKKLAHAIADAVMNINMQLIVVGLSGSYLISEAKRIGLATASEVFADRTYHDDGSLTPRTDPDALIEDQNKSIAQILQIIKKGTVKARSGKDVKMVAQTICLHGDGPHAVPFAKAIHTALKNEHIALKSLCTSAL